MSLFVEAGFGATTVEQIAARAEVARRTFFRYFPSKEAVLFADLIARQRWAMGVFDARPVGEPPLTSLLAVFGELCEQPIDRGRRQQVRRIVARQPDLLTLQRRVAVSEFEEQLVGKLLARSAGRVAQEEARVLTSTVLVCVESAWRVHLTSGRSSLRAQFDLMVDACVRHWGAEEAVAPVRPGHVAEA